MIDNDALGDGRPERNTYTFSGPQSEPEGELLRNVLGDAPFVTRLARAGGGWRTLSAYELDALGLTLPEQNAVLALQMLTLRSYPELSRQKLLAPVAVANVYEHRLGGLVREVMLAIALDGKGHLLAEIEVAMGGAHSLAVRPRDVLRPLLRVGASAFILLHNHPSADPAPSPEDIVMTRAMVDCANAVGLPMVDHLIIAGRGGGFVSLLSLGVMAPVE